MLVKLGDIWIDLTKVEGIEDGWSDDDGNEVVDDVPLTSVTTAEWKYCVVGLDADAAAKIINEALKELGRA